MPLLAAQRVCKPWAPCRRGGDRCSRCEALDVLTDQDWYLIQFYRYVEDQYINQTPMGGGKDQPPLLTPRLEAYQAALESHGYPRELWAGVTEWAKTLHRLHRKLDVVSASDWLRELGKPLHEVKPEDLLPR